MASAFYSQSQTSWQCGDQMTAWRRDWCPQSQAADKDLTLSRHPPAGLHQALQPARERDVVGLTSACGAGLVQRSLIPPRRLYASLLERKKNNQIYDRLFGSQPQSSWDAVQPFRQTKRQSWRNLDKRAAEEERGNARAEGSGSF